MQTMVCMVSPNKNASDHSGKPPAKTAAFTTESLRTPIIESPKDYLSSTAECSAEKDTINNRYNKDNKKRIVILSSFEYMLP